MRPEDPPGLIDAYVALQRVIVEAIDVVGVGLVEQVGDAGAQLDGVSDAIAPLQPDDAETCRLLFAVGDA